MSASSNWQHVSALTVYQAALLMVGEDPVPLQDKDHEEWPEEVRREAVLLIYAIKSQVKIKEIEYIELIRFNYDFGADYDSDYNIDWKSSKLSTNDIRKWAIDSGVNQVFFRNPNQRSLLNLEPGHQYFAPKLYAANAAWQALVANPQLISKTSVKIAAERWLEQNAKRFGLVKPDGRLNKTAISEIAAVVNWNPKGGAPTSGEVPAKPRGRLSETSGEVKGNLGGGSPEFGEMDDEIPF